MKHIVKGREPRSLTVHRRQAGADYDNYAEKDDLRDTLLMEQGDLCCYCMRRIAVENMKIEHWASQTRYPNRQLDYQNLLAACEGGMGAPKHLQHCDTRKGDDDIRIHPADRQHNCETYIRYQADGEIYSDNDRINHDLNKVLNLNLQRFCYNRKAVLVGMLDALRKKRPDGVWTKSFLQVEQRRWSHRAAGGQFLEYCQVVSYHLQKKIARTRN